MGTIVMMAGEHIMITLSDFLLKTSFGNSSEERALMCPFFASGNMTSLCPSMAPRRVDHVLQNGDVVLFHKLTVRTVIMARSL